MDNLSVLVGSNYLCSCVQVRRSRQLTRHISDAVATYLLSPESYYIENPGIFTEGNFFLLHHNILLGVTNEEVLSTPIKEISGAVAGDSKASR